MCRYRLFAVGTHWREEGGGRVVVLSACKAPAQVARLRLNERESERPGRDTDTTDLSTGLYNYVPSCASSIFLCYWRVVTRNWGMDLLVHSCQKPGDRPLEA